MPLFAAQMGGHLGATGIGMVISAPALATLVLSVPLGRLCDTVGRKPLMQGGTAFTAIGTILTGYSGSLLTMLPCRLLVGAGGASSMTGSSAYLADLSDRAPQHRAKIMGINAMIAGSVWTVGPALGGWLAMTYGLQNSFLIAGIGAGLCSIGYSQLPETLTRPKEEEDAKKKTLREHYNDWLKDILPLMGDRNQQSLIAVSVVPSLRWACFSSVVALHASNTIGAGPLELGYMFSVLAVAQGVGMPLGSWLADKSSGAKKPLVIVPSLFACASFGMLGVASELNHYLAVMACQGLVGAFTQPAVGAFQAEVTPSNKRGQAMSLQRQAGSITSLLGPVSFGILADTVGCAPCIMLTAGLMGACNVVYLARATAPASQ